MSKHLTLFLLLCSFATYGQDGPSLKSRKSQYSVNLTFTPQLFLNHADLENDDIEPDAIRTKNTGGYTIGTEIERRSKTGFILNAGFQYGVRHYSFDLGYKSLSFFLPEAAEKLNSLGPQLEHHSGSIPYFKFRIMAGYVFPFEMLHNYHIEMKAGFSVRFDQKVFEGRYYRGILISKNDTLYSSAVGEGYFRFGADNNQTFFFIAEWYIGLCKNLDTRFIKNVSVGIEMTRAINIDKTYGDAGYVDMNSYKLYDDYLNPSSRDKYRAKDFSIGLRLSVGLWHK